MAGRGGGYVHHTKLVEATNDDDVGGFTVSVTVNTKSQNEI